MYNIKDVAKLINGDIKGNDSLSFIGLSPFFKQKKMKLLLQPMRKC